MISRIITLVLFCLVLSMGLVRAATVNLAWDAANDPRVTGYVIERCTGAVCANFTPVGQVTSAVTTYSDTTLQPATAYRWQVKSTDGQGNFSVPSNIVSQATPALPLPPPTNLRGTLLP